MADLKGLPKAELHLHLEGSMRRSTLVELCHKYGLEVPIDTAHRSFDDFSAFVSVYIAACSVIRSVADLQRLVLEVAEDAKSYGAVWLEVAPSFTFYADRLGGKEATLRLLAEAVEQAETATGVGMGIVVSIERQLGIEEGEKLAQVVLQSKGLTVHGRPAIIGLGLHGPEEDNPPAPFRNAFEMVCGASGSAENGNHVVASLPHAGEIAPFPGQGAQSVLDAIQMLHAKRIAHGVLATDDAKVLQVILSKQICLDICVSSNYLLQVCERNDASGIIHPLPQLLQKGIPCTINSDDPLLFGCTLLSEYELCRHHLNLTNDQLALCAKASFEHSCAPEELKQTQLSKIDQWLLSQKPLQ